MYYDYPLEQGLRLFQIAAVVAVIVKYYDYPLEQGLRRGYSLPASGRIVEYYDYPLEQGLRQLNFHGYRAVYGCIMIIH